MRTQSTHDWKTPYEASAKAVIALWDSDEDLMHVRKRFMEISGCSLDALFSGRQHRFNIPFRGGFSFLLRNGFQMPHQEVSREMGYSGGHTSSLVAAESFSDSEYIVGINFPNKHALPYSWRNTCRIIQGRDWKEISEDELFLRYSLDSGIAADRLQSSHEEVPSRARAGFAYLGTKILKLFSQSELTERYSLSTDRSVIAHMNPKVENALKIYSETLNSAESLAAAS